MTKYICETCGYTTAQKCHYDTHKARKRTCKKSDTIEDQLEQLRVRLDGMEQTINEIKAIVGVSVVNQIVTAPIPIADIVKPFLKWVGGKTQIINDVLSNFPADMENYHEPFIGGGSVLLALLTHRHNGTLRIRGTIYASDLNANLIALYKTIQANPEALIAEVKKLSEEFANAKGTDVNRKPTSSSEALTSPESYYFWIRSRFNAFTNEQRKSVEASAMLLFMNKTCFRGVYREGPHGFNVPFGNYKNPSILDEEHIRFVSRLFKDVVFQTQTFQTSLATIQAGDFAYLDPPYAPENETSFVGYVKDGFSLEEHRALFKLCSEMSAKNVKFLMSNASVKLVTEAFPTPTYNSQVISCRRAIHSKEPDARTNEVLITN
jgi:DNA adenine methylase